MAATANRHITRARIAASAAASTTNLPDFAPLVTIENDAASGLRNRVRANLRYLEKGERVLKEGSGPGAVWRLA